MHEYDNVNFLNLVSMVFFVSNAVNGERGRWILMFAAGGVFSRTASSIACRARHIAGFR
jgi:hypothetical protein